MLLRMASAQGNKKVVISLLRAINTPEGGKYAAWQFSALAGFLDALDGSNSSLTRLHAEGDASFQQQIERLSALFASARATVANRQAGEGEQLAAIRLLGRGLDRHQEDMRALAAVLLPQTPEPVQTAAVAALGRLYQHWPGLLK